MRAWNRKHKPKFATKIKITKYYSIITFLYAVMKPKCKFYNYSINKMDKGLERISMWTNKYRGW